MSTEVWSTPNETPTRKGVDARRDGQKDQRHQLDNFDRGLVFLIPDPFHDLLHINNREEPKRNPMVVGGDEPDKGRPCHPAVEGHPL